MYELEKSKGKGDLDQEGDKQDSSREYFSSRKLQAEVKQDFFKGYFSSRKLQAEVKISSRVSFRVSSRFLQGFFLVSY